MIRRKVYKYVIYVHTYCIEADGRYGHMSLWKKYLKNMLTVSGVVLWVGALSPEIFIQPGPGCILDRNGEELTEEEAGQFMEAYFYGKTHKNQDEDTTVGIKYKFALLEWLQ